MYFLLFGIHIVFIGLSYLFGYYLFGGLFFLLLIFFLLYFSPVFFQNKATNISLVGLPKFSPKESIVLPIILLYTALYVLLYALTGSLSESFRLHIFILLGVYGMIFSYMFGFEWKNSVFFDITKIHTLLSYITLLFVLFFTFFTNTVLQVEFFTLLLISLSFSWFYFSASPKTDILFFLSFLFLLTLSPYTIFLFFSGAHDYAVLLSCFLFPPALIFEYLPRFPLFQNYLKESRIFTLAIVLIAFLGGLIFSVFSPTFFFILFLTLLFLFSVHIRFQNYPVFLIALFGLFFLYATLFLPIFLSTSIVSVLLFIFFLPFCIVANTYFWQERHPQDIHILHSMSIGFSILFSLYSILFLPWGGLLLYVVSLAIFGLGILLLLSYFRFRYH